MKEVVQRLNEHFRHTKLQSRLMMLFPSTKNGKQIKEENKVKCPKIYK